MTEHQHPRRAVIESAAAGCPLGGAGEGHESGDVHVLAPFPDGVLVGAIDGLGHGAEAAHAARIAARVLAEYAGQPVQDLVQQCHERLRHTRGAVLSLASVNSTDSAITWLGVGNVDAVLLRKTPEPEFPHEALNLRGGIVGYQLPPLRASTLSISHGDTLIMATDGIRSGFTAGVNLRDGPQKIAESILALYTKGSDDSLVVVARYLEQE
jgi:phosphoserine phosphatase RsbX